MTSTSPSPLVDRAPAPAPAPATTDAAPDHVADTAPYAWPWDGDLAPHRLALVIAGCDTRWSNRSVDAASIAGAIDELADLLRHLGVLVVHISHDPRSPGHPLTDDRSEPGTGRGARVDAELDLTIVAGGVDGFFASPLDACLRRAGRDHLLMTGFGLEGPVHSTLRSANDAGYECLLLTDLCATLDPTCRDAAVSTVTMSGGIFGAVGTSTALGRALTHHRESP